MIHLIYYVKNVNFESLVHLKYILQRNIYMLQQACNKEFTKYWK